MARRQKGAGEKEVGIQVVCGCELKVSMYLKFVCIHTVISTKPVWKSVSL